MGVLIETCNKRPCFFCRLVVSFVDLLPSPSHAFSFALAFGVCFAFAFAFGSGRLSGTVLQFQLHSLLGLAEAQELLLLRMLQAWVSPWLSVSWVSSMAGQTIFHQFNSENLLVQSRYRRLTHGKNTKTCSAWHTSQHIRNPAPLSQARLETNTGMWQIKKQQ